MTSGAGKKSSLTDRATRQLRNDIRAGRLGFGDVLPSEARLCQRFSVSRITVRRALACLKQEQLIESRAGKGHFVLAKPDSGGHGQPARTELLYVHNMGRGAAMQGVAAGIFTGAAEEALRLRRELHLCCLDAEGFRRIVRNKNENVLRGVLFDWNDPEIARFLIDERVPFTVVEGDFDDLPVAAVVQDDVGGTQLALEHLSALGHRRIAYLGPDDGWVHSRRRMAGYRQFHLSRGWPVDSELIAFPEDFVADGRAAAERILNSASKPPTAVYVADRRYLPGLQAATAARGWTIPTDFSVVVWGDPKGESTGSAADPNWTHISWDRAEMGRLAVRLLEDRAEGGSSGRMQVLVSTKRIDGTSTAGPRTLER